MENELKKQESIGKKDEGDTQLSEREEKRAYPNRNQDIIKMNVVRVNPDSWIFFFFFLFIYLFIW